VYTVSNQRYSIADIGVNVLLLLQSYHKVG